MKKLLSLYLRTRRDTFQRLRSRLDAPLLLFCNAQAEYASHRA